MYAVPLLFRKMVSSGLGPKFCQLIENMYANASSCIKLGTTLGTPFSSKVGLWQGDPLSPLFNLFVADLIFAFTNNCDRPPYMILPSPQSSSQMISAISRLQNQALGPPLSAPYNIVQPIGSRSISKSPVSPSSTTPNLASRTLLSRDKPSSLIPAPATWACACQTIGWISTPS